MAAVIRIDGVDYDFPQIDTLTLDEAMWLYQQSGLTLDQVGDLPEGSFHPGFIKGMLFIAVKRASPTTRNDEIEKRLGELKLTEMQDVFVDTEDEPPLESQNGSEGQPVFSGATGTDGSAISPEPASHGSTGLPVSGSTSTSGRLISAG